MMWPAAGPAMILEGARAAYGLSTLRRPSLLQRLLGARNVLQGGVTALAMGTGHARAAHGTGAGIDTLHALSMLGLAAAGRAHRRFALRSAFAAVVLAAGEALACSRAGRVGVR